MELRGEGELVGHDFRIDFVVIGAQKSGTTTLASQLAASSDVSFCAKKEPGFFNRHEPEGGALEEYHRLYDKRSDGLQGEASTMYTFLPEYPDTHDRLYRYNPKLKLIYIMRDPVERIASHLAHRVLRGRVRRPVVDEVLGDPTYVNRSRYGVQLRPYLRRFGPDAVLPLVFEDFVASPGVVLERVQRFLGIPIEQLHEIRSEVRNRSVSSRVVPDERMRWLRSGAGRRLPFRLRRLLKTRLSRTLEAKPELDEPLRQTLAEMLADDARFVRDLLGRDLDEWRC